MTEKSVPVSTGLGLSYRKGEHCYYVEIGGETAGWVVKTSDGTWSFYAQVWERRTGERLAWGCKTRREAVWDGLGTLRIRHLGRIYKLAFNPVRDEPVYFEEATLKAIGDALMEEMYPS